MKVNELITEAITEFLNVEVNKETDTLDFASKIEIVKNRITDKVNSNPNSYGLNPSIDSYEYEMFFRSNPNDMIKIDGWMPIDKNKIEKADKIKEYIEIGLLRKTGNAA